MDDKLQKIEVFYFLLLNMKLIFYSGRVHRKFVPTGKILRPVLNECVTPVTCYWSLALLLRDDYGLMLVFKVNGPAFSKFSGARYGVNGLKELILQNLNPPAKMLIPIWKALCAFVDSNTLSASVLPQLHDPHKCAEQDGGEHMIAEDFVD